MTRMKPTYSYQQPTPLIQRNNHQQTFINAPKATKLQNTTHENSTEQSQIYSFGLDQRTLARQRVQSKLHLHRPKEDTDQKILFRNAEKLKHFEEMKANNIDQLNCKIKNLINKLNVEDNAGSTYNFKPLGERRRHERLKTDCGDYSYVNDKNYDSTSKLQLTTIFNEGKPQQMSQSQIIQNVFNSRANQATKKKRVQQNEVDLIRKKYQAGGSQCKQLKHQNSSSSLSNNSKVDQSYRIEGNGGLNADLIRFRQRIKQNYQKQRKQLSLKMNVNFVPSLKKQNSIAKLCKNNIDDEMARYNQRIDNYNSNKINSGLKMTKQRIPLGDSTQLLNTQTLNIRKQKQSKYEKSQNKYEEIQSKIKLKIKHQNQRVYHQNQEPLTADFRYGQDSPCQLKQLIKNLQSQVQLDQQFRNGKKWLSKHTNPQKINQLIRLLQQKNVNLEEEQIKQIFSLSEQEDNPFYSSRGDQFNMEYLVQVFIQCEQNWFQNIVKKYNRVRLQNAGFIAHKLDIANKGYIDIQDLVRFMNMELDAQIRNRDMFLIYERLKSEDQLTYQDLMEVICE